jgi:hypothetical protein
MLRVRARLSSDDHLASRAIVIIGSCPPYSTGILGVSLNRRSHHHPE